MPSNKLLNNYLDNKPKKKINLLFTKILICLIIIFASLIFTSINDNNLILFKKYVFNETFKFMDFRSIYYKYAGNITNDNIKPVFKDTSIYINGSPYLDGQSFTINNEEMIETISSGIVVYIGEKDGFNKTVIVQSSDGYDIWYGNLDKINVKIYDYLKDDDIIAIASEKLYLQISKDNKYYTYAEYQNKN